MKVSGKQEHKTELREEKSEYCDISPEINDRRVTAHNYGLFRRAKFYLVSLSSDSLSRCRRFLLEGLFKSFVIFLPHVLP